jgi:hypothetical protein
MQWSGANVDLDSVLWVPSVAGNTIYWGNAGSLQSAPWAALEGDALNKSQPETTQLSKRTSGTYAFGVYRPDGFPIGAAKPKVTVYRGKKKLASYSSKSKGQGSLWCVFTLNGASGTVSKTDRYGLNTCSGSTPLSLPTKSSASH